MSPDFARFSFVAEIAIDGVVCDPDAIWSHQQNDPYPGGHRYEVRVTGLDARRYFERFHLQVDRRLDSATANWFLQHIERALRRNIGVPYRWVLNTVDSVAATDERIVIAGVCSPFVRHEKRANQPPEPTALLVTPRADARVAPSNAVAHL